MRFDYGNVVRFLLSNGVVATLRTFSYKPGQRVMIKHGGRILGTGRIVDVLPATPENIRKYTIISGWKTPKEWILKARFAHGRIPDKIVIVVVDREKRREQVQKYLEQVLQSYQDNPEELAGGIVAVVESYLEQETRITAGRVVELFAEKIKELEEIMIEALRIIANLTKKELLECPRCGEPATIQSLHGGEILVKCPRCHYYTAMPDEAEHKQITKQLEKREKLREKIEHLIEKCREAASR